MELYPGWSARDNYGYGSKKKKRKKDRSPADSGGINSLNCAFVFVFYLDFIFINFDDERPLVIVCGWKFCSIKISIPVDFNYTKFSKKKQ